ncbi:MAG: hypothetical protein M3Q08_19360, partial [Pseudomonadota bacterium]|nr:hypothetical protein [Pseudomonadota bacterium]
KRMPPADEPSRNHGIQLAAARLASAFSLPRTWAGERAGLGPNIVRLRAGKLRFSAMNCRFDLFSAGCELRPSAAARQQH